MDEEVGLLVGLEAAEYFTNGLCRFAKRRRDASIIVAIFFVWCVFCGVRANEHKEKLLKKIRERERERTPTNQPSDAILYLFAKTSKFVPFLSRVSLSLSQVSLSLKNVWRETSF